MSNLELLDRAAGATMCDILRVAGPNLVGAGVWSVGTGFATPVAIGAMTVGAASLLAANYLCEPMDLGGTPPLPGVGGCQTVDGYGQLEYFNGTEWKLAGQDGSQSNTAQAVSIVGVEIFEAVGGVAVYSECEYTTVDYGTVKTLEGDGTSANASQIKWRINPTNGTCSEEGGPGTLPPEVYEPRTYVDESTNCAYNVTFQGFFEPTPGGAIQPVLLIEGAQEQRNDYGRMGGCNFNPTVYMPSGDGGGGTTIPGPPGPPGPPVPPGPDAVPWWLPPLISGATGAALNLIGQALKDLLETKLPAGSFTLVAPCDTDEAGQPLERTWSFPAQKFTERSIAHQITELEVLQQHLNWKTPICNEKPILQGQWVTTRWLSTEKMDHSGVRLRKLFRYRTKSTRNLGQLSAYWEDFEWESGDVCVFHKGAWWGTPQVWARTEEEGKRVIRFAAAEAGIDPDQVGEWGTGSSRSPRYGMSGTMKIHLKEGFPWVSSRDGASWPNTLARAHYP